MDYALPADMDETAKDLLIRVFKLNPDDRPTTQELMMHPFFSGMDFDSLYESPSVKVDETTWRGMLLENGES